MSSMAGRSGAFLMSWSQTELDGHSDACLAGLQSGAYWRWSGEAVEISAVAGLSEPGSFPTDEVFRQHLAKAVRTVVAQATGRPVSALKAPEKRPDRSFSLSDGRSAWIATLIAIPGSRDLLLAFAGALPPASMPLRIDWVEMAVADPESEVAAGGHGLTAGTWIETPGGSRQIEHLSAGDKVLTLDAGVQEVIWIGERRLSLGELRRAPELAPVRLCQGFHERFRPDEPLVVAPDQRLLLRGRKHGMDEVTEVLVSARDMVDGVSVRREALFRPVTYFQLLLERHHVIMANGFETETFHPAALALNAIPEPERQRLLDVMPVLGVEAAAYGPSARPVVSRAEIALLAAA